MENSSDLELINNIKTQKNVDDSLQELISRHSGVYLHVVTQFTKGPSRSGAFQDIIDEKDYKIYLSALKFDESKGCKFSTFVGEEAKWACMNLNNIKIKNSKRFVEHNISEDYNDQDIFSRSEYIPEDEIQPEIFDKDEKEERSKILLSFISEAEKCPDERVSKIFKLRYCGERKLTPWRKISAEMGLSIQGCINIHNSALKNLSKHIKLKNEFNI